MKSWSPPAFWYHKSYTLRTLLLLPISWLFRLIVAIRTLFYQFKLTKTLHFSIPVIVIGNITVGGTGKTPLVIWIANFLKSQGYHPAIVSRGCGGKKQLLPYWVDEDSDPHIVGDEAILLAKRTHCSVVICIDRVAAVKDLMSKNACNVILADDGLQHYRLGRDIEIAVVDGERQLGNGCFLPAGPLRESPARLQRADFVVLQGNATKGELTMQLLGEDLALINDETRTLPLKNLHNKKVHVVAGIGHPERFFSMLRRAGLQVIEHPFPDHHLYCAGDFNFTDPLPIIMTEKDAVKCKPFADDRFWYLPVTVKIDKVFQEALLAKLKNIRK